MYAIIAGLVSAAIIPSVAYAHGVPSGFPTGLGTMVRLQSEQFSINTVDMDSNNGGVITITGTLQNLDTQHAVKLIPYISVQSSNPFGFSYIPILLHSYYPIYEDPSSWYFRTESNLTTPFIIHPNEEVGYQIKVYPLKAGLYHIHSFFLSDIVRNNHYLDGVAAGQIVSVSGGSSLPTTGEIAQLYLPLAIGAAAIAFMVTKAIKITKEKGESRSNRMMRGGVRIYFAVKSSLETVWLAGLLSWLVLAAYPTLQPFAETRFVSLLTIIAIIAAITVGGYIAAIAKSRKIQSIAAIGAASATIIFYVLMFFYWLFVSIQPPVQQRNRIFAKSI